MDSIQLATLLAKRAVQEFPAEFISRLENARALNLHRWDAAPCALVQAMSDDQRAALLTLIRWAVVEAVTDVLGVVDPMSGNDESGDLSVTDVASGAQLEFLQGAFMRECSTLGFD